jgi:hypothetical protein
MLRVVTQPQVMLPLQEEEDFKTDHLHLPWTSVWENSFKELSTKTAKTSPEPLNKRSNKLRKLLTLLKQKPRQPIRPLKKLLPPPRKKESGL